MMGIRGAKGEVTYKEARHLLAYALVPLAASLFVLWPIRLAVYGSENSHGRLHDAGNGYGSSRVCRCFRRWMAVVLVIGYGRASSGPSSLDRLADLTLLALLGLAVIGIAAGGL